MSFSLLLIATSPCKAVCSALPLLPLPRHGRLWERGGARRGDGGEGRGGGPGADGDDGADGARAPAEVLDVAPDVLRGELGRRGRGRAQRGRGAVDADAVERRCGLQRRGIFWVASRDGGSGVRGSVRSQGGRCWFMALLSMSRPQEQSGGDGSSNYGNGGE
jgi:hypothetical protein